MICLKGAVPDIQPPTDNSTFKSGFFSFRLRTLSYNDFLVGPEGESAPSMGAKVSFLMVAKAKMMWVQRKGSMCSG